MSSYTLKKIYYKNILNVFTSEVVFLLLHVADTIFTDCYSGAI